MRHISFQEKADQLIPEELKMFTRDHVTTHQFGRWSQVTTPSNSPKNRGETGIFAEDDVHIKDTGQQN